MNDLERTCAQFNLSAADLSKRTGYTATYCRGVLAGRLPLTAAFAATVRRVLSPMIAELCDRADLADWGGDSDNVTLTITLREPAATEAARLLKRRAKEQDAWERREHAEIRRRMKRDPAFAALLAKRAENKA